jgi:surface antigen
VFAVWGTLIVGSMCAPSAGAAPAFVSSPGLAAPGAQVKLVFVAPDRARACVVRFRRGATTIGPFRVVLQGPYVTATWTVGAGARGRWTAHVGCGASPRGSASLGAAHTPIAVGAKGAAAGAGTALLSGGRIAFTSRAIPATLGRVPRPSLMPNVLGELTDAVKGGRTNPYACGGCSAWAWRNRPDLPRNLGNPRLWAANAGKAGFPTDATPDVGAIAVFQPCSHGAWCTHGFGHLAVVEQIRDGQIYVSEASYNGARRDCGDNRIRRRWTAFDGVEFIHRQGYVAIPPVGGAGAPTGGGGTPTPPGPPLPTDSGNRVGIVTSGGDAYVKDGGLDAAYVLVATSVRDLVLSGKRLGVVYKTGAAAVKEGALDAPWVTQGSGISDLVLDGSRIGVIDTKGDASVKDGALDAAFVSQGSSVDTLAISATRVGILTTAGDAKVKEGALTNLFTTVKTSAQDLVLDGNRIGVINAAGDAEVKEGALDAAFAPEGTKVKGLDLAGDRIGIINSKSEAQVKEGALGAEYATVATAVIDITLSPKRVGVMTFGGGALVKEGALSSSFVDESNASGVHALQVTNA